MFTESTVPPRFLREASPAITTNALSQNLWSVLVFHCGASIHISFPPTVTSIRLGVHVHLSLTVRIRMWILTETYTDV